MYDLDMGYYEEHAKEYAEQSANEPIREDHARFLSMVPKGGLILDVGFGGARSMLYFQKQGRHVCGIDTCEPFVERAASLGLEVKTLDVLQLEEREKYDGVWASASLLHLKKEDLPKAIDNIARALKSGGAFYCSFKYGDSEREEGGRHFTDLRDGALLRDRFEILWEDVSEDALGRGNRWLSLLCRKKTAEN